MNGIYITDQKGTLRYQIGPRIVDLFGDVHVPASKYLAQFWGVYIRTKDDLWEWVQDFDTETQARDFVAREMESAEFSPRHPVKVLTPDDIAPARDEYFVLADFGDGFKPAAWSPVDQHWMVCVPKSIGKDHLQKCWFELEMVSENRMVAWVPV